MRRVSLWAGVFLILMGGLSGAAFVTVVLMWTLIFLFHRAILAFIAITCGATGCVFLLWDVTMHSIRTTTARFQEAEGRFRALNADREIDEQDEEGKWI